MSSAIFLVVIQINPSAQVEKFRKACHQIVGAPNTRKGPLPTTASEDFSFYQKEAPGCFLFVGGQLPDGVMRPHHKSTFDVDERSLIISASLFVQLIDDLLISSGPVKSRL